VTTAEHWNRLHKEVVECPSLEIFKPVLDTVPEPPAVAVPALSRGGWTIKSPEVLPKLGNSVIPDFIIQIISI